MYERQLAPGQWARHGLAADLLPVSAGLLIAHQKVLVVDAGQMKCQPQSRYISSPHQTGVTERSIGRYDRNLVQHVVDYVMIGYVADRVSAGGGADLDRDHLLILIELCPGHGCKRRTLVG